MRMPEFTATLGFKLAAAFAALICFTSSLMAYVLHRDSIQTIEAHHRNNGAALARQVARTAAALFDRGRADSLQDLLVSLGAEPYVRYALVFDADGRPVAAWSSGDALPSGVASPEDLDQPERLVERLGGTVYERNAPVLRAATLENDVAVVDPELDRRLGTVRIGMSMEPLERQSAEARRRMFCVVFSAVFLGCAAAFLTVRSFVAPIGRLVIATEHIARGDFGGSATRVSASGELGKLADAIARMSRALSRMRAELTQANATLEQRVEDRTRELKRALHDLEDLDRMKDGFLSSVSHEFRTPIAAIRAATEILVNFPDERIETRMEFLHAILTECDRLTRLVGDILDLVQIESGDASWRLEEVDLVELARQALNRLAPLIDDYRLVTSVNRRGDVPRVRADRERVSQVMTHLLSNAIKFSERGGRIDVEIRPRDEACVEVIVRDEGIGIDPEEHESIFDRFRQVGDTLTDKPQGAGLGLPLCRSIVDRHGGRIWVESAAGGGSSFHFTLPINGPSPAQLKGRLQTARGQGHALAS